jgi:DNA mismatch repair protein MutS
MAFKSILFPDGAPSTETRAAPAFFRDLNLDPVVHAITAAFAEYDLQPFFYTPLGDVAAVVYRQEVMRDLEGAALLESVQAFAQGMRAMRAHLELAKKAYYPRERERWVLDAAVGYCDAVDTLASDLTRLQLASSGLRGLRDHLGAYIRGAAFTELAAGARDVKARLSAVRFCLLIKDGSVTVSPYEEAPNYSAEIEATFEKFRRGAARDYRAKYPVEASPNHVEAAVLDRVALLFPDTFRALTAFASVHADFVDASIAALDRELQFYVSCLAYIDRLRRTGLPFCYPRVSAVSKTVECRGAFDVALADKLVAQGARVVPNDISLVGAERILVVTGPNQGGKSTFARMFGQLHYLASLGCLVPGTAARLFLFDRLFTHFEKEEDITNLRGKLQDDIIRVREILDEATPDSIVIMNEIFSSTALEDAVFLSRKIMGALSNLDALTVWVTFLAELASFDEKTVSVVGTVAEDDPTRRTYRVERRPARGLAYSLALAERHGVTYDRLKERLSS